MDPPQPYKDVQPLVIRANAGDEIHINFYNSLGRRVSMHVQGLRYDVLTSDGQQPVDPHTGLPSETTGISYRSEPMRTDLLLMKCTML